VLCGAADLTARGADTHTKGGRPTPGESCPLHQIEERASRPARSAEKAEGARRLGTVGLALGMRQCDVHLRELGGGTVDADVL